MAVWINNFAIDAAVSETHSMPSTVTSFPVEEGSPLTDHIRPDPIEVEIVGIVSDTPIGVVAVIRQTQAAEVGDGLEILPSEEALAMLERIRTERQPVTIQTSLKVYERMGMQQLEIPRDKATGKALGFTARFVQITTVSNERTTIRTSSPAGSKKRKLGPKGTIATALTPVSIVFTVTRGGEKPDFVVGLLAFHERVPTLDELDREIAGVPARDHYIVKEGYIADGRVMNGRYQKFARPFRIPKADEDGIVPTAGAVDASEVVHGDAKRSDFFAGARDFTEEDAIDQWRARFR